jgi:hypothetical protein
MTTTEGATATIPRMATHRAAHDEQLTLYDALGLLILGSLMFLPRLFLAGLAIFDSGLLRDAFSGWVIPLVGFLLLPSTTFAFAVMWSISSNVVSGIEWAVVAAAFLLDVWAWSAFRR